MFFFQSLTKSQVCFKVTLVLLQEGIPNSTQSSQLQETGVQNGPI